MISERIKSKPILRRSTGDPGPIIGPPILPEIPHADLPQHISRSDNYNTYLPLKLRKPSEDKTWTFLLDVKDANSDARILIPDDFVIPEHLNKETVQEDLNNIKTSTTISVPSEGNIGDIGFHKNNYVLRHEIAGLILKFHYSLVRDFDTINSKIQDEIYYGFIPYCDFVAIPPVRYQGMTYNMATVPGGCDALINRPYAGHNIPGNLYLMPAHITPDGLSIDEDYQYYASVYVENYTPTEYDTYQLVVRDQENIYSFTPSFTTLDIVSAMTHGQINTMEDVSNLTPDELRELKLYINDFFSDNDLLATIAMCNPKYDDINLYNEGMYVELIETYNVRDIDSREVISMDGNIAESSNHRFIKRITPDMFGWGVTCVDPDDPSHIVDPMDKDNFKNIIPNIYNIYMNSKALPYRNYPFRMTAQLDNIYYRPAGIPIVSRTLSQELVMNSQTDSHVGIVKPVFIQAKASAGIVVHPQVNENIIINLDRYKSSVSTFTLKIEGAYFSEIARMPNGIVFNIQGNKLPGTITEGIYYILNEMGDLVTTGKYTYES